ncbi:hypothetical protein HOY80DRAFT_1005186 [Tuber brumale]|nr:hypothetical protein HOY80DRAFT_1005186 [Tuber brumale]
MPPRDDHPIWQPHHSDNNLNTPNITTIELAHDAISFAVGVDNSEISLTIVHGPAWEQPIMTTRTRSASFSDSERGPELSSSEENNFTEGNTENVHGSYQVATVISEPDPDYREEEAGSDSRETEESFESEFEEGSQESSKEDSVESSEGSSEKNSEESSEDGSPGGAEERAERKAEEGAERKAEEGAERKAEEGAERKAEERAERKGEERAERKVEERAERKGEERAERKAEEKAEGRAEENPENCNEDHTTELGDALTRRNTFGPRKKLPYRNPDLNSQPPTDPAEPIELPTDHMEPSFSESPEPDSVLHQTEDSLTMEPNKNVTLKFFSVDPEETEDILKEVLPTIAPKMMSLVGKAQNELSEALNCVLLELSRKYPDMIPELQGIVDESHQRYVSHSEPQPYWC